MSSEEVCSPKRRIKTNLHQSNVLAGNWRCQTELDQTRACVHEHKCTCTHQLFLLSKSKQKEVCFLAKHDQIMPYSHSSHLLRSSERMGLWKHRAEFRGQCTWLWEQLDLLLRLHSYQRALRTAFLLLNNRYNRKVFLLLILAIIVLVTHWRQISKLSQT